MAASPLAQAIISGMDPGTFGALQNLETGQSLLSQGMDSSPTSGWGALGRLAQAAAGTYLQSGATSDLAKAIAAGKKSAYDQLYSAFDIPSASAPATHAAPATSVPRMPLQAPPKPVAAEPGSANAEVAERFPAEWSPQQAAPAATPAQPEFANAISGIESGGKYSLLGPVTKSGDRAYGKYQVMGKNIPEWSQAALGKKLTPKQFLADPAAQDAIFGFKFGQYVDKYGPEGAAKAWFAGESGMKNPNARDQLGTSVQSYADQFDHALGNSPAVSAIEQAASGTPTQVAGPPQTAAKTAATEPSIDVHKLMAVLQNPYADDATKQIAQKLILQQLTPKEDEFASSPQGIFNKRTGELKEGQSGPGTGYGDLQGQDLLAAMRQKEPGLAARAQAILEGKAPLPTSSRVNSDDNRLKQLVPLIQPGFEAGDSKARMKMQADLSNSSNNSMGGILSNGKSSFAHLAELSDNMAKNGNYNGPNVPGGTYVAGVGNFIGNKLLPNADTSARQTAINDNALKYGQEATKFYAGSGGGEAERLNALENVKASTSTGKEQAAFLRTEKSLMLDRLAEKERQIRDVMGQDYLDKHPVMSPELQANIKRIDGNIAALEGTAPSGAAQGEAASAEKAAVPTAAPDRAALEAEMRKRGLLK